MAERSALANSSSSGSTSRIDSVQVDGLVVLKIIKHCQDEGSGGDLVQGVLLGLIQDNKLEITNCFPFPSARAGEDDDEDDVNYQMEMMRRLRAVNVDHLQVGWYQSTYLGSFVNKTLLDAQFSYQSSIEESVVLIYDPLKATQGMLSLKVFRLSDKMMSLYKEADFTAENKTLLFLAKDLSEIRSITRRGDDCVVSPYNKLSVTLPSIQMMRLESDQVKGIQLIYQEILQTNIHVRLSKSGLSFEAMLVEIPLVIRNSSLVNTLLCEVELLSPQTQTDEFLSLSTGSYLEKNVRLLMETVDELCQDANKYNNHLRNVTRQQQQKDTYNQRRQSENLARQQRGEPPLSEEDLSKIFKPLPSPSRLDHLLLSQQVNTFSKQVNQFATHSFGKLFLSQALQDNE